MTPTGAIATPWPQIMANMYDDVVIFHMEQGSPEWYEARCGIPTASQFSAVLATSAESKVRSRYMRLLAGEIMTGRPMETFSNSSMTRGKMMEPLAIEEYEFERAVEVDRIGFMKRVICDPIMGDLVIGCSPDGIVPGGKRLLEIKTMQPDLLIDLIDSERFPSEHMAQVQGNMLVSGCDIVDLKYYFSGFPRAPIFAIERDEKYIARMEDELRKFVFELGKLVERVRNKGRRG